MARDRRRMRIVVALVLLVLATCGCLFWLHLYLDATFGGTGTHIFG